MDQVCQARVSSIACRHVGKLLPEDLSIGSDIVQRCQACDQHSIADIAERLAERRGNGFPGGCRLRLPDAPARQRRDRDQADRGRGGRERVAGDSSTPAVEPAVATGVNLLTLLPALQVFGQGERAGVAPCGITFKALKCDPAQGFGCGAVVLAGMLGVFVQQAVEPGADGRRLERRLAGDGFVEHAPEREDVGGRADVFVVAHGLFGGHVGGCAEDFPGGGHDRVVLAASQAEVGDDRVHDGSVLVGPKQNVGGLEIAVQDAVLVSDVHGFGDPDQDIHPLLEGQLCHLPGERAARHELHEQLPVPLFVLLDAVDAADVGMVQALLGGRLPPQSGDVGGVGMAQALDGQDLTAVAITRTINASRSPFGDWNQRKELAHRRTASVISRNDPSVLSGINW